MDRSWMTAHPEVGEVLFWDPKWCYQRGFLTSNAEVSRIRERKSRHLGYRDPHRIDGLSLYCQHAGQTSEIC